MRRKNFERLYARPDVGLHVERGDVITLGAGRRLLVVDVQRKAREHELEVFPVGLDSWLSAGLVIDGRTPVVHPMREVVRLTLVDDQVIEFRSGVPASRSECAEGQRPCPYVRCKWHLWRIDADDRAGNPNSGNGPTTTLRPAWLENPLPPSCALDIAERGESSVQDIARAMSMHRGNVWLIWKRPHVRETFAELRELLQIGEGYGG